jgi:hypothetical protein
MSGAESAKASSEYGLTAALFLRLLALIYLAAFISTGSQIIALAGDQGILPVAEAIAALRAEKGWLGFFDFPTLFWFDASNDALFAVALAGCAFSVALFLNFLPRVSLILLFVFYLSLFHAGQLFMNFQWDYMLLESGFLAIFLAGGSRPTVWLLRWLLFRIRFLSGLSKLVSQDPTWSGLTALAYFFEVQPLPHWGGWYAHQLPEWILKFGTGATLFIEIIVPFMMFMPRRIRFIGAWLTILMQVLILLTSNHNYANFMVLVLCLFLFDDRALRRVVPAPMANWLLARPLASPLPKGMHSAAMTALALFLVTASVFRAAAMLRIGEPPQPIAAVIDHLRPFHIVNNYHVFPTMKTERIELLIEGSVDGVNWEPYEFKYKPGDVNRRPEVIVPHHPRVDWLMWFVTSHPLFLPWFENFLQRLLDNSPAVLALMDANPFREGGPRYLRVSAWRYRFTTPEERAETGQWWHRDYLGPFTPLPWLQRESGAE